jgi:hypothetical protein
MPPWSVRLLLMDTMKEFEIRLFDEDGAQRLVVPVIAENETVARARAETLRRSHDATRYEVRGMMRSARHAAGAAKPSPGTESGQNDI